MGDISQNGKLLSSLHSDDGDSMEKIAQSMWYLIISDATTVQ